LSHRLPRICVCCIVHAAGRGAKVNFFSIAGADEKKDFVVEGLKENGVSPFIYSDESRPTTLKQRYRANGKTLLRVSHLRQHEIDEKLASRLYDDITSKLSEIDLLIFSDFILKKKMGKSIFTHFHYNITC
jgi:bifunctional ADP-heptose synthase (sugar kinase/adenylyltransferase)